jgi:hypothetical protein
MNLTEWENTFEGHPMKPIPHPHPTYLFLFQCDDGYWRGESFPSADEFLGYFTQPEFSLAECRQAEKFLNLCSARRVRGKDGGFFWFLRTKTNAIMIYLGEPQARTIEALKEAL